MAGLLLAQPVLRAMDANGVPMAGAQLQFYLTGTTTPTPVYSSATLSTPLSNPVVADSGGLFAPDLARPDRDLPGAAPHRRRRAGAGHRPGV